MARNVIVVNVDLRETRVAIVEGGVIAELHIERKENRGTVGNVVLGRVTRVLPGMQAAFIDIGQERAAFLHVEDLIRPDDFDAYLSGGFDDDEKIKLEPRAGAARLNGPGNNDASRPSGDDPSSTDSLAPAEGDDEEEEEELDSAAQEVSNDGSANPNEEPEPNDELDEDTELESDSDFDSDDEDPNKDEEEEGEDVSDENVIADDGDDPDDLSEEDTADEDDSDEDRDSDSDLENDDRDSDAEEDEDDDVEVAAESTPDVTAASSSVAGPLNAESLTSPEARTGRLSRRRRRRRKRSGGGEEVKPVVVASARHEGRKDRSRGRSTGANSRDRAAPNKESGNGRRLPARVSRSVPISEVVKEGAQVVVQVSKEPIGTKGARVTSHVSLPGRYVVYLPTVDHLGISKRIGNARERARLRTVIESLRPPTGGLIVRTVAEGLTKKQLKADIGYLIKVWAEIGARRENAKAPVVLYEELDLILKVARDFFTDDVDTLIIDDREQYVRLLRFVEMFMPARAKDVKLYTGEDPVFDAYGIEDEIRRALSRKVPLPSGGSLIVDQAEALTAIDVNTGRYVGKGSKDLEETALKNNLEAVDEIAYQLRFRNIGGLVILDLIDMEKQSNRDKVWRALEQKLAKDKAKTTINRISELGLIEMTRKRTRESLGRTMNESCFYCDGTGHIQSRETIAYEILRQIRRERVNLPGYSVRVNAHPAVVDFLKYEAKGAVQEAERRYLRRIDLEPKPEYHIEQYDLQGK